MRLRTRRPSSFLRDRASRPKADCRRFAASAGYGARIASRNSPRRKDLRAIPCSSGRGITNESAAHARAVPNAGHDALARLERVLPDLRSLRRTSTRCICAPARATSSSCTATCGKRAARLRARRPLEAAGLPPDAIEHACGGRWRPDIVWFGEPFRPRRSGRAQDRRIARRGHPRRRHERGRLSGGRARDAL